MSAIAALPVSVTTGVLVLVLPEPLGVLEAVEVPVLEPLPLELPAPLPAPAAPRLPDEDVLLELDALPPKRLASHELKLNAPVFVAPIGVEVAIWPCV